MSEIETKHYDGSYCPECKSDQVEIKDNSHDFGYLELEIICNDCNCFYSSQIQVSSNKLLQNEITVHEHGKTFKEPEK